MVSDDALEKPPGEEIVNIPVWWEPVGSQTLSLPQGGYR